MWVLQTCAARAGLLKGTPTLLLLHSLLGSVVEQCWDSLAAPASQDRELRKELCRLHSHQPRSQFHPSPWYCQCSPAGTGACKD